MKGNTIMFIICGVVFVIWAIALGIFIAKQRKKSGEDDE